MCLSDTENYQMEWVDDATLGWLMGTCRLVDEVVWVKTTTNRRLAKSHGYYLQHAKEVIISPSTLSSVSCQQAIRYCDQYHARYSCCTPIMPPWHENI